MKITGGTINYLELYAAANVCGSLPSGYMAVAEAIPSADNDEPWMDVKNDDSWAVRNVIYFNHERNNERNNWAVASFIATQSGGIYSDNEYDVKSNLTKEQLLESMQQSRKIMIPVSHKHDSAVNSYQMREVDITGFTLAVNVMEKIADENHKATEKVAEKAVFNKKESRHGFNLRR